MRCRRSGTSGSQKIEKQTGQKAMRGRNLFLGQLTDIHLHSNLLYETSPDELRDGDSVYALSIIALLF